MKTLFLSTAILAAAGTLCAQTTALNKISDWSASNKNALQTGAAIKTVANTTLTSAKAFTIDPAKTYSLQATVKNIGKTTAVTYFGIIPISAKGISLDALKTNALSGTDTQLAAPLKKGDVKLVVKDGSKWKAAGHYYVIYNTKPDFSDLPSTSYIQTVKSIAKTGANWTVTLAKPSVIALPAGANVRLHAAGGWMYSGGYRQLKPGETFTFKGSVKGILAKPGYIYSQFPIGSKSFRVIFLSNYSSKDAVSEISNVSLTVK